MLSVATPPPPWVNNRALQILGMVFSNARALQILCIAFESRSFKMAVHDSGIRPNELYVLHDTLDNACLFLEKYCSRM